MDDDDEYMDQCIALDERAARVRAAMFRGEATAPRTTQVVVAEHLALALVTRWRVGSWDPKNDLPAPPPRRVVWRAAEMDRFEWQQRLHRTTVPSIVNDLHGMGFALGHLSRDEIELLYPRDPDYAG